MSLSGLTEQDWYKRFEYAEVKFSEESKFKKSFEKYCENFDKIRKKGLGIMMYGSPGTGKTYYTTCIMNVLNQKYLVYKTTLSSLLEEIRKSYKNYGNENDDFLFERFYRMDSSRNSSTGGHGVGLSLAKSIVTMHKGKVVAISDENANLKFIIEL